MTLKISDIHFDDEDMYVSATVESGGKEGFVCYNVATYEVSNYSYDLDWPTVRLVCDYLEENHAIDMRCAISEFSAKANEKLVGFEIELEA